MQCEIYVLKCNYYEWPMTIAGQRHRDQCRRHRHSGTMHLSPVTLYRYRTALGIGILYSLRYRIDRMPYRPAFWHLKELHEGGEGYTLHLCTAGGGEVYTLHVHTGDGVDGYTLHVHTAGGGKGYTLHVYTAGRG
jgi:hypothetical protein